MDKSENETWDVVILGAGLVGVVMALLLKKSPSPSKKLRIKIIEKSSLTPSSLTFSDGSIRDGRTTAISFGSVQILKNAGVWNALESHIHPIHEIRVFEAQTPFALNFLEDDKANIPHHGPLGYMINNGTLRDILQNSLLEEANESFNIVASTEVIEFSPTSNATTLTLSTGEKISTHLVISCEGRHAPSRKHFGIKAREVDYHQTALVATLTHTLPHNGVAFEVFHPKGPIAFLPLPSHHEQHRSALVWSSTENLQDGEDQKILENLYTLFPHFGNFLSLNGKQFYPLKGQRTSRLMGARYVLIGDAAHVLHPVAGQGVNLGWRDACVLTRHLTDALSIGYDMGSTHVLEKFEKVQLRDQRKLFFVSDNMIRLFGIDHPFVKMARSYGLGIVNRIPPLKNFLMKQAMGK